MSAYDRVVIGLESYLDGGKVTHVSQIMDVAVSETVTNPCDLLCSHLSHKPVPPLHLDPSSIQRHQSHMSALPCQSDRLPHSGELD